MEKIILIDANALIHRAFHALPPLTSPKGIVTNAVFGFASILIKTIKDMKPDYVAAAFDLAAPTFRHEEFAEYKIHREKAPQELYDQIPMVKDLVAAFGIPVYEKQGYEADDLIGSLATMAKKRGDLQVIIATGDLDTLQLVDDKKVVVFTLRKGVKDTVIYDEKAVIARYGLKPEQMNDYRGLKGDPSDNIPGVPGVGEKTGSILIKEFGSLDNLYKSLEKAEKGKDKKQTEKGSISPKLAEKLLENKDQAFFSKQLSTIVTDLDIDFSFKKAEWRKNLDLKKLESIFKELGFLSLLKRLPEIGVSEQTANKKSDGEKHDFDPDKNNIYVIDPSDKKTFQKIKDNPEAIVIGHDLKNLFKQKGGTHIKNKLFDIKIAAYLLNPDVKNYGFEEIHFAEFRETPSQDPEAKPAYMWRLKERLLVKMELAKLIGVFEDIEMPLIKVLAEMEQIGIDIDEANLKSLLKSTNKELAKIETKIYKLAGTDFNINSPSQLSEILFNKLQIKGKVRKTGGGALSTAAPELEKLREEHAIIDPILQYRELQKLKTTYIEPFPLLISKEDGRLHTTYNQTGAATGRLASQDPNLQNIPTKTELGQEFRKSFIAAKGYKLISFDYSQLELRIVAHIAKDKKMIEVFKRGEDIHTATAAEIFEVEPKDVTKEMRRQAKALNFGIIYGMGPLGFSRASGVNRQRAREFIDKYFEDFSGVAEYMEKMKDKAHAEGYVETIFGRRRPILDIHSTIPQVQAQAERMAINHPVQGTEADLMKMAMIKVSEYIHKELNDIDVRLLLQVHDELVFEVKEGLVKELYPKLRNIMDSIYKLAVPLTVDVKYGQNWQEMQSLS
ncbi:MAG: DNA polymerase I [Candidatus Paceibacterota bacterium]